MAPLTQFDMSLIAPIIGPAEESIELRRSLTGPDGLVNLFRDMFEHPEKYDADLEEELQSKTVDISLEDRVQLNPQEWAERYRLIKGQRIRLYNYQATIINDMTPKQVIQKAAQLGISEIMLTKLFWWADYRKGRANIIYTFPTFNDMSTYAAARITPIVQDAVIITPDDPGWYAGADLEEVTYISTLLMSNSVQLKKIRDTYLFLKGTMGDRNAISVDSDWNLHDEVNFSDQSVLNKFRSRLGALSSMGWEYDFSTPTIPGYGVSALIQDSDMKRWYVRCPHCGKRQHMEFETHVVDRPRRRASDPVSYYYRCEKCGAELTQETIAAGEFIAEQPEKAGECSGYCLDKMMLKSADQLMKGKDEYRRIADFYNFDLGLPYAERSIALTADIVRQNFTDAQFWSSAKPSDGITAGIDQGDTLWAVFSRINPVTGKRQIIYMEEVDERECPNNDPFLRVEELLNRYSVQCAVFDMNPNKNDVRKLRNKYPGRIFMATYAAIKGEIVSFNDTDMIVNIDRTEYFKEVFNRIYMGGIEIPSGTSIGEVFVSHLCNMQKQSTKNEETSETKEFFIATGPDHLSHANLYDEVAREYMKTRQTKAEIPYATARSSHWDRIPSATSRVENNIRPGMGGAGVIPRGIRQTPSQTRGPIGKRTRNWR